MYKRQPIAFPDTATVREDGANVAIDVLANDTDADTSDMLRGLTVVSAESAAGATITGIGVAGGSIIYNPRDVEGFQSLGVGETTTDTITYRIRDNINAVSNTSTVTVTVQGTNDGPVAVDDIAVMGAVFKLREISIGAEDGVLINDIDPDTSDNGLLEVVPGSAKSLSLIHI